MAAWGVGEWRQVSPVHGRMGRGRLETGVSSACPHGVWETGDGCLQCMGAWGMGDWRPVAPVHYSDVIAPTHCSDVHGVAQLTLARVHMWLVRECA